MDRDREQQLASKANTVTRHLAHYPQLARMVPAAPVGVAPELAYRLRAKLVSDGTRLGLYAAGSHEVVDTPGCPVLEPAVRDAVDRVRAALSKLQLGTSLRGLDVRKTDSGLLVTLILSAPPRSPTELEARLRSELTELGELTLAYRLRDDGSPLVLGHGGARLSGPAQQRHRLTPASPWTFAAPGAFVQAHGPAAAALAERVADAACASFVDGTRPHRILELFAGSGALTFPIAQRGLEVLAVEDFPPAAEAMLAAAQAQNLPVRTDARTAAEAVNALAARGEHVDVVVMDPPRRGLDSRLGDALERLAPRRLVYVSCEPRTLARDAARFERAGWAPLSLTPFDLIPHSHAVESLYTAERGVEPPPRVIHRDERLLVVDKPQHEPTIPQGEHASSLLARVRRLPGAERAVPVHRLDRGTSGICLFALAPEFVEALAAALTAGEKRYRALVRGIIREKGSVTRPLEGGKAARTRYKRLAIVGGHSLVEVRPDQGRKHQIRIHLAGLEHPVLGDERHGHAPSNQHFFAVHGLDRPFLHLAELNLPTHGTLRSPLAPDLQAVLDSLAPQPASGELDDSTPTEGSAPPESP